MYEKKALATLNCCATDEDLFNVQMCRRISPQSPASPPTFTVDDLPPPPAELLLPAKSEQPSKPDVPHTKPPVPLHKTAGSVPALHRPPPSVPSDDGSRSFSPQASKGIANGVMYVSKRRCCGIT